MKYQRNHAQHQVGLILALIGLLSAATLLLGPARPASAQAVAPSWSNTGNLKTARNGHTATLLLNGKVLVAGGFNPNLVGDLKSAELYDPATVVWSRTGNLNRGRTDHTATLLPNGKVLVAGGISGELNAELYDPATGTWGITGNFISAVIGHTATLLTNGKVLVAGGLIGGPAACTDDNSCFGTNTAQLYDIATGTWSSTGNLNTGRFLHTATLLSSGKVLVAGGFDANDSLNSAELYDPATGTWTSASNLNTPRDGHTATLLPNGKVLVATGNFNSNLLNSAEVYDPDTETWTRTGNLNVARGHNNNSAFEIARTYTATLLRGGKVLVAGGNLDGGVLNSAELYDPTTGSWTITASLNTARGNHTATLLTTGKILAAGGSTGGFPLNYLDSAELYDPGPNQIDGAQFFVRQHYLDFLNREPDQSGWDYWTSQIIQCGSDAHCIHERRIGVSAAFFIEQEFQDTGYFVYRFYKASFGRQPNYAEFTSGRGKVIGGSNLENNKQAFADEWVQRAAFTQAYPITMSNTEVVNKLFDSGGLTSSLYDAQRQQEILAMNAGRSRAVVLRDVIEIPDFKNAPDPNSPRYSELKQISQYNPAFVLMEYFGYLHRDLDRIGYDFWLDVVNNREPNNYLGMVCSFVTSTEYQLRFGSAVTRSNADCGQ